MGSGFGEHEAQQHRRVPLVFDLASELRLILPVRGEHESGSESIDAELPKIDVRIEEPEGRASVGCRPPNTDGPFLGPTAPAHRSRI